MNALQAKTSLIYILVRDSSALAHMLKRTYEKNFKIKENYNYVFMAFELANGNP